MKKVLVITYHFPPEGGPAVQRVTKFVKYLHHFDYVPSVLTSKTNIKIKDHSLLKDIHADVEISRSQDIGQFIPGDMKKRVFSKLFLPDKFSFWKYTAIKKGVQLVNDKNIDIIFSTSPPHSVHLVAHEISKTTGKPWIADFRDEWTGYPLFHKISHQEKHHQLENQVLQNCSHIITTTKRFKDNFVKKINENKVTVIPNGFDPDDFLNIQTNNTVNSQKLILTYCGRLNQLHSPLLFFESLISLFKEKQVSADELLINIIGNIENKKYIKNFPALENYVKFAPYQPHATCIKAMAQSSALLLLATNMGCTQFFPAKMYEYFMLKKPILAIISNKGELSDVLDEYGAAYIGYEDIPGSIIQTLRKFYQHWQDGHLKKHIHDDFIRQFNRIDQTECMTRIFDKLLIKV